MYVTTRTDTDTCTDVWKFCLGAVEQVQLKTIDTGTELAPHPYHT